MFAATASILCEKKTVHHRLVNNIVVSMFCKIIISNSMFLLIRPLSLTHARSLFLNQVFRVVLSHTIKLKLKQPYLLRMLFVNNQGYYFL